VTTRCNYDDARAGKRALGGGEGGSEGGAGGEGGEEDKRRRGGQSRSLVALQSLVVLDPFWFCSRVGAGNNDSQPEPRASTNLPA
jgi:hypothetical protein